MRWYFRWVLFFTLGLWAPVVHGQVSYDQHYTLLLLGSDTVHLVSDNGNEILEGSLMRRVDLNADGKEDLLINLGACGNWGHCIIGVFVQVEPDSYRCVWSAYNYHVEVLDHESTWFDGQLWKKILLIDRGDYGGGDPEIAPLELLEYDMGHYVNIPAGKGRYENGILNRPEVFHVYASADGAGEQEGERYELGRNEQNIPVGPIVLRKKKGNVIQDIHLPYFQDIDLAKLYVEADIPYVVVIQRYAFMLVDVQKGTISPVMMPGREMDYREDAISGLMDGFIFFDEGHYLLGNAQGYGVFCFDVSEKERPTELRRYSSQSENKGNPYFFLGRRKNGLWDGILAQSDVDSEMRGINNLFKKTKNVRYTFREEDLEGEPTYSDPLLKPVNNLILRPADGIPFVLEVGTGRFDCGHD